MYWILDNRPPTVDERILQAKARHAERVEQIAAEEPVPQIVVPAPPEPTVHVGPTFTSRPGHYIEGSEEQRLAYQQRMQRSAFEQMAAQQNMGMQGGYYGMGLAATQRNVFADATHLGGYPFSTLSEAQHTFQVTKDGTRWLSSRGPLYQPPRSFGTLIEFV